MQAMYFATPTQYVPTPRGTPVVVGKMVLNQRTMRAVSVPEEGSPCLCRGCPGKMRIYYPDDRQGGSCTCFLAAPCGRCTNSALECDECLEDQGEVYDRLLHSTPFNQMPKHRRRRMIEKINKTKRQ
jgi:hypothetical protein